MLDGILHNLQTYMQCHALYQRLKSTTFNDEVGPMQIYKSILG